MDGEPEGNVADEGWAHFQGDWDDAFRDIRVMGQSVRRLLIASRLAGGMQRTIPFLVFSQAHGAKNIQTPDSGK